MLGRAILPELEELIRTRDFATLKEVFESWHPSETADIVSDLAERDRPVVFRLLSKENAADTFEYLDLETQKSLLHGMGLDEVGAILNEMAPDDRTGFLQELPGPIVKQLIDLLSPTERAVARNLLGYPEGSIGRLMKPEYITVSRDWTIARVLNHIREHGKDVDELDFIYVVDEQGRLIDDIRTREFLISPVAHRVAQLMDETFVRLTPADDKEQAVKLFKQYDRTALPVINNDGFLLGIVTIDDVLDVVEEMNTQDIQKFGGVEALDYPYIKTPLLAMAKKRAGWLVILFLGEMLTATAMGFSNTK